MPRPNERACLNDGLRLGLKSLFQRGFLYVDCANKRGKGIAWNNSYWGQIAAGVITFDIGKEWGRIYVTLDGEQPQAIELTSVPRHYGGRQWYFVCPRTGRLALVLWRPNGSSRFLSRPAYGRQVDYRSQFLDPDNRAHHGQAKIKARLLGPGMDPDDWDLPPKPKGMRWRTYQRHVDRFDRYDEILDMGIVGLAAKLLGKNFV